MPKPEIQQAAIALVCASLCALQIYVFHWGVITPDTVVQYGQALTGNYDDWHPPITAWLWRQLLIFHRGSAPFLVFDSLLYWGGFAAIAEAVRRQEYGVKAGWFVILLAALPIGFGQIGAILKDSLMAALLVAASAIIVWRERSDGRLQLWLTIAALPLIVVASATRFNAAFAAAPLLLLLIPRFYVRSLLRLIPALAAAALLLATTGWLINGVALRPHRSSPIFSLVNFDLAGIAAYGGGNPYPSLNAAEAKRLTARCYDPRQYGAHDAGCAPAEDRLSDYVRIHHVGAISLWLSAVLHAPLPYIAHRLGHLNWNWRFLLTEIPNDAVFVMSQPNDLGLAFSKTRIAKAFGLAGQAMAWSPLGRPISWLCIAIGLLIAAPALPSRRVVIAMAGSALLYGCAYAFVSVAPDLRYNLWTMLAVMIALATALVDGRAALVAIGRKRLICAIAPAVVVSVLEMGALIVGVLAR